MQNNVFEYKEFTLVDYVFCCSFMVFTNILNPESKYPRVSSKFYIKTFVKKGASLGANCTIVRGNTIGQYAFVEAVAVVSGDVPDFALALGNPVRLKDWYS